MTVFLVIVILFLLIVAHEFGHFIAAKIFRVRVDEFGVGYPPRAFTFGRIGDTEYTLNWIPFGGFVRLFGDEGEIKHGRGSLIDSARWKQAIILVAGVTMNVVAAWLLFAIAFYIGVPQAIDTPVPGQAAQLIVSGVVPGSPAAAASLKPGDEILAMTDARGKTLATLTPSGAVAYISVRGGKPVTILYKHANATSSATIIPANAVIPEQAGQPALGVALVLVANQSEPPLQAMIDAFYQMKNAFGIVLGDLSHLGKQVLSGTPDLSQVVGPVGIVSYVGQASQNGVGAVLMLAALISINLAIINLIPIPALDGGRLFVLGIEAILRRPAPRLAIQLLNALGISLIVLLMIVVTYHDIARLLT